MMMKRLLYVLLFYLVYADVDTCDPGLYWNTTGDACVECPIGTFSSGGFVTQCEVCPQNHTTKSIGQVDVLACVCDYDYFENQDGMCQKCPSGMRSKIGAMYSAECLCPRGTFLQDNQCQLCPIGSFGGGQRKKQCEACPATKTTKTTGATKKKECSVDYCPAGHFMKKKSECVPCHRGQYREANTDVSSCISCPALHTTLEEGSTQIKDCVCERNTFLNQKNKCQNCPLGAESEPGSFSEHHCKCPLGTTSDPTYSFCTPCPKGTFGGSGRRLGCSLCPEWWTTSKPGAKVESECSIFSCPIGHFVSPKRVGKPKTTCEPCEAGYYSTGGSANHCKRCPMGTTSVAGAAASETDCGCVAGEYFDEICRPCPVGSTNDNGAVGLNSCRCKAGDTLLNGHCTACPRGTYSPGEGNLCLNCPRETSTDISGAISVFDCTVPRCPKGTFLLFPDCKDCPMDTYTSRDDERICTRCPEGMITVGTGATECVCPSGHYYDVDSCVSCPMNHTSEINSTKSEDCVCQLGFELNSGTCQACGLGSYRDLNNESCVSCPDGTTTAQEGSRSKEKCTVPFCRPGEALNDMKCTACPRGTFATAYGATECTACPKGLTTFQLGTVTASQCFCPSHQYASVNGTCLDCPEYSYSYPGADYCVCNETQTDARQGCT